MNVYLSFSSTDLKKHVVSYSHIRNEILKLGHNIPADWLGRIIGNSKIETPSIKEEGISAIEKSDCLIADVSISSSSVGYQIAFALSKRIPTLCLYSEEFGEKIAPKIIEATDSSLLRMRSYNSRTLKNHIVQFFKALPSEKLIKFNFIITPEIDDYLNWASKMGKYSKSEILREKVINKVITSDNKYQLHLHKRTP